MKWLLIPLAGAIGFALGHYQGKIAGYAKGVQDETTFGGGKYGE